jgi:hypothetical protein
MSRDKIARWLIEKLLASFIISAIIIWGPIIGFNIQTRGLGTTYSVVTSVSILISIIANILVPQDFGISRRLDELRGKKT